MQIGRLGCIQFHGHRDKDDNETGCTCLGISIEATRQIQDLIEFCGCKLWWRLEALIEEAVWRRSVNGTRKCIDMSFMLTSRHYIPAESSFEMQMAEARVDANRAFTKPLRYDGEVEFSDFRLRDQDGECVVEVWGMMGNPDYEARKTEKIKSYKARCVQVIEWDTRRPMPDLTCAGDAKTLPCNR